MDDAMPENQPPRAETDANLIVEFRHVHKWFDDFHVLRDINIVLGRGEKVVVCGPSGSGKSTMIRCINRLEKHQEGTIIIDGTELTDDMRKIEEVRRSVGMVFQSFNLFPHLSVIENLTMAPVYVHGIPEDEAEGRALELLERVKIPEQAWKYPGQLSGGQQQLVAIARALMLQPKVMLFDEPTSALDPELVGEVLKVIRDIAEEGRTMIIVTHEMAFAREVSSKAIFLHDGRVEEEGPPSQVFGVPRSERCRQFLAAGEF